MRMARFAGDQDDAFVGTPNRERSHDGGREDPEAREPAKGRA